MMRARYFPDVLTQNLDGHYIVFVVDCRHELGGCTRTIWGEGRSVSLIPLGPEQLGGMIYQDNVNPAPPEIDDPLAWRSYLSNLYADFPVWVHDAVAALKAGDEVFSDQILMVPASALARGRLALVGDAGYCPTFFSGMGAAAALIGAYALTRQLDQHSDPVAALSAYEARMLPIAKGYQSSAFGSRRRTLARGWMSTVRNVLTARLPEKIGDMATRRNYQSEITMAALS